MAKFGNVVVFVFMFLAQAFAQVEFCDLYPPEVQKCFIDAKYHPVNTRDAHVACVREFYVDTEPDLNLTKSDWEFFNYRLNTKFGLVPPPSGFRIRKEYRRLSKDERIRLHSAFNVLYQKGIMQRFGRLHATATRSIHRGASFLPWHRVFIADLEEELRKVDPSVALAYWDYTMDNNMTLPSESVVFTPCFFGNGNGTIISGPFRGWYGGRNGPIQRDIARNECNNGRLINKKDILKVLSKCRLQDISVSHDKDESICNLEILHDGVHVWLGGDLSELSLSAFDPVFYFLHAFVDYIWELFRRNQALRCGVNPEKDYPVDLLAADRERLGHKALDRMYGYEHIRNIDGLSHIFTEKFYKYETVPQCPDCGSPYLYCDTRQNICVSRDKTACDIPVGRNTYVGSGFEDVQVGFTGDVVPALRDYPMKHPFPRARAQSDPRHRDMSLDEAQEVFDEMLGINSHQSPEGSVGPFTPVSAGGNSGMAGFNGNPTTGIGGYGIYPGYLPYTGGPGLGNYFGFGKGPGLDKMGANRPGINGGYGNLAGNLAGFGKPGIGYYGGFPNAPNGPGYGFGNFGKAGALGYPLKGFPSPAPYGIGGPASVPLSPGFVPFSTWLSPPVVPSFPGIYDYDLDYFGIRSPQPKGPYVSSKKGYYY